MNVKLQASLALALTVPIGWALESASFVKTLTVSGAVELDVVTSAGHIAVKPGSGTSVEIRGLVKPDLAWTIGHEKEVAAVRDNPPIEQSGNTIRVKQIADETVRRHIQISYDITTPAETRVHAKSGAGAITVEGVKGPVDVVTGAGSLKLTRVGGDVNAVTGAGKIEAEGVQGTLAAKTGAGAIEARGLAGAVKASSGTGSVRLEQTAAAPIEAQTGTGSLHVSMAKQGGYNLSARTGMGTVHVDPALAVNGLVEKRQVKGTVRGGGAKIDLSTGMGSVRVE